MIAPGGWTKTGTSGYISESDSGTACSSNEYYEDYDVTNTGYPETKGDPDEAEQIAYETIWAIIWCLVMLRKLVECVARSPPHEA